MAPYFFLISCLLCVAPYWGILKLGENRSHVNNYERVFIDGQRQQSLPLPPL